MAVAFALIVMVCAGTGPATNETCTLTPVVKFKSTATIEDCEKVWKYAKDIPSKPGTRIAGHSCISLDMFLDKPAAKAKPPVQDAPKAEEPSPSAAPDNKFHV